MTVKYKKTQIKISFFFALAVTVMLIYDTNRLILLNLCAAVLHEIGHLSCLLFWREMPKEIVLTPFGMRIERSVGNRLNFNQEIVTAFAGPFVNLLLADILGAVYAWGGSRHVYSGMLINLIICALNMLPCEPLDGGRIVYFSLCKRCSEETAKRIMKFVSCVVIFPVAVFGFYVLIQSGYNFSLLLVAVYLTLFLVFKK